MTPADTRRFKRNPKVEEAPLQGELMLFEPETSRFFVLNRTMAFLWRHCDSQQPLGVILEKLEQEFEGVEAGSAGPDLRRALEELLSLGLVLDSVEVPR